MIVLGTFEAGNVGEAQRIKLGHRYLFRHHKGNDHFAPFCIGFSDHRDFMHVGMAQQNFFDFAWIDICAT